MLINCFDSQGVAHKQIIPDGKRVHSEFCKGVMDRLLKRIQQVRAAAFCCPYFFLLHDNVSAHKVPSVCQFLAPPKKGTTIHHPS